MSPQVFRSTPARDGQPRQPGIKAKSFISSHKKSLKLDSREKICFHRSRKTSCLWSWQVKSGGTALPTQEAHQKKAAKEPSAFLPAACDMALFTGADC